MTIIYPYENSDTIVKEIGVIDDNSNIIYCYNNNNLLINIVFNKYNKELYIYLNNFSKNLDNYSKGIYLKILIGARFIAQENDIIWKTIERPSLKTHYYLSENLNNLNEDHQFLLKFMLDKILYDCKFQKIINFDTNKDYRRCFASSINQSWYLFPG